MQPGFRGGCVGSLRRCQCACPAGRFARASRRILCGGTVGQVGVRLAHRGRLAACTTEERIGGHRMQSGRARTTSTYVGQPPSAVRDSAQPSSAARDSAQPPSAVRDSAQPRAAVPHVVIVGRPLRTGFRPWLSTAVVAVRIRRGTLLCMHAGPSLLIRRYLSNDPVWFPGGRGSCRAVAAPEHTLAPGSAGASPSHGPSSSLDCEISFT